MVTVHSGLQSYLLRRSPTLRHWPRPAPATELADLLAKAVQKPVIPKVGTHLFNAPVNRHWTRPMDLIKLLLERFDQIRSVCNSLSPRVKIADVCMHEQMNARRPFARRCHLRLPTRNIGVPGGSKSSAILMRGLASPPSHRIFSTPCRTRREPSRTTPLTAANPSRPKPSSTVRTFQRDRADKLKQEARHRVQCDRCMATLTACPRHGAPLVRAPWLDLGAPVTKLSHAASFHSFERIAPSNSRIKHPVMCTHDKCGHINRARRI